MMRKILFTTIVFTLFSSQAISAADGTLNFSGNIIETACTISSDSKNQTIDLGTVSSNMFKGAGSTGEDKRFYIDMWNCPASMKTATIRFDGKTASENPAILALNPGEQTAKNIGVAIFDVNGRKVIPIGVDTAPFFLSSNSSRLISYIVKYMALGDNISGGVANATTTFTISYK